MIWLETPTNPMLSIIDIEATVRLAKAHDLLVVVDNTFATPWGQQRPLESGLQTSSCTPTTKFLERSLGYGGRRCNVTWLDEELGDASWHRSCRTPSVQCQPGRLTAFLVLRGA